MHTHNEDMFLSSELHQPNSEQRAGDKVKGCFCRSPNQLAYPKLLLRLGKRLQIIDRNPDRFFGCNELDGYSVSEIERSAQNSMSFDQFVEGLFSYESVQFATDM